MPTLTSCPFYPRMSTGQEKKNEIQISSSTALDEKNMLAVQPITPLSPDLLFCASSCLPITAMTMGSGDHGDRGVQ